MMGRTHALSGTVVGLGTGLVLDMTVESMILCTLLSTGAAMIPDLDHPKSSISLSGGILTRGISSLVEKFSGGHRKATHSLLGVLVAGVLSWVCTRVHLEGLWIFLMVMGLLSVLPIRKGLPLAGMGLALTFLGVVSSLPTEITPWCLVLGMATHILGDTITVGGCPLLFPNRRLVSLRWFRTNHPIERVLQTMMLVSLVPMGMVGLGAFPGVW